VKQVALAIVVAVACLVLTGCDEANPHGGATVGARALEGRLLAPCCWIQTLDVHESELASSLRAEISQRLARGESGEAIEDDLAARYGERIRAVPKGRDPRSTVPVVVGIGMLASLFGLVMLARRWTKGAADATLVANTNTPKSKRDEYDDRIEDELAQLDDL